MERKVDMLARYIQAGDYRRALSLPAKFPQLGTHAAAIRKAHEAYQRPDFYRQIGTDPNKLVAAGIAALRARYAKWL